MGNKTYFPNTTRESRPFNLDADKLRRANALVTAGVSYKEGDLLTLSDANVADLAADEKTWNVLCGQDVTAEQSTAMAASGVKIPVYFGGTFSIEAVRVKGEYLTAAQYQAARAKATLNNIELSSV